MNRLVNEFSQLDQVHRGVDRLGLRHGDTARVRVSDVRVAQNRVDDRKTVFFCNSRMELLERLGEGDGAPLPEKVVVENLDDHMPFGDGQELIALVTSNGAITMKVERIVPRPELAGAIKDVDQGEGWE